MVNTDMKKLIFYSGIGQGCSKQCQLSKARRYKAKHIVNLPILCHVDGL